MSNLGDANSVARHIIFVPW